MSSRHVKPPPGPNPRGQGKSTGGGASKTPHRGRRRTPDDHVYHQNMRKFRRSVTLISALSKYGGNIGLEVAIRVRCVLFTVL